MTTRSPRSTRRYVLRTLSDMVAKPGHFPALVISGGGLSSINGDCAHLAIDNDSLADLTALPPGVATTSVVIDPSGLSRRLVRSIIQRLDGVGVRDVNVLPRVTE